jgi:hypothetical protein
MTWGLPGFEWGWIEWVVGRTEKWDWLGINKG